MSSWIKKYQYEAILLIIMIIGAFLRFYNCVEMSLSNDELSTLKRLQYGSIGDVIEKGVMGTDVHPAGIQVFLYYWVKVFGESVLSVRFPFIIFGILSIPAVYLIVARWFGKVNALFAAASISLLQFPVFYSQLARLYSPGLLFTLLTVLFWTMILFNDKAKKKALFYVGYIVFSCLSMYTHYFSFLFAGIVGITGLFFLKKHNYKAYLLSGIIMILLFIPHLNISIHHFSYKGVEWLGKPSPHFFVSHIYHGLNESYLVLIAFAAILTGSVWINRKIVQWTKYHTLSLIFFLVPFFIGYFYSVYCNPILQHSGLLFSFPYLIIFGFSFIHTDKMGKKHGLLLAFYCCICLYSLVMEKKYYQTEHFGEFKKLALTAQRWSDNYGNDNIEKVINIYNRYYIDYYFNDLEKTMDYEHCEFFNNEGIDKFISIVKESTKPYFIYAWSNIYTPKNVSEIIMAKYPIIVEDDPHFNSGITLYEKEKDSISDIVYHVINDLESGKEGKGWGNYHTIRDDVAKSGIFASRLAPDIPFSVTFKKPLSEMGVKANNTVMASLWCYMGNVETNACLVVTFESDGKVYSWNGVQLNKYVLGPNKWKKVYLKCTVPPSRLSDDIMAVYVWNPGKEIFYVDDFDIMVSE